ncbi:MAG TPA: UDP-N-acetylglucosamine--N-acetylmuramyl-(pentapeptide) pyrophosphoryl-undecaprenol N-acetylglucosamine transferase [bacterium]|nr:UDP-N-acetylglucosamine--N-acetylmuramyl-(pentapeptide) pyrophosphoryl-undecaprenol N-acetylglucosamine transferase [bacterium]
MKILFTGGGSGGHVFPIIAVAREMRKIFPKESIKFFYIGPKDQLGSFLLSQEGIAVKYIFAGKIRRYWNLKSTIQNLIDIFIFFPLGFIQSFIYIFFLAPDIIFSKGGYGSLSPSLAGWVLQAPIFLHESDVAPGLSNKILGKIALEIFVSFPRTEYFAPQKMVLVGNPIRRELLEGSMESAKKTFKLTGEKPIVLFLGGSQGAQRINDLLLLILPTLLKDFELIHQVGIKNFNQVKAEAAAIINKESAKYYHPVAFLKEAQLKDALAASFLVISRAGSNSIFEIAALGKPSILIPLPESAQDHQVKNAYAFANTEGAWVIEEKNLSARFFLEKLKYLFSETDKLQRMSQKAKEFSKPMAAKVIATYFAEYLIKSPFGPK